MIVNRMAGAGRTGPRWPALARELDVAVLGLKG
jgi:hypothetical protein